MTVPNLRPAVRVVLVDPDDRVLMVRWTFPDLALWGLPGGGVEPGETNADAVRRELLEEVGHDLAEPGPCVAHRTHVIDLMAGWDGQEEWFYLARVPAFEPRGQLSDEELAAEQMDAVRWFSLAELHALPTSGPEVVPAGAAAFLERLVQHGHPAEPVELAF